MEFDYVVVGAGFAGAVSAEQIASRMGRRVLVIDRRDHVGGNAWDHLDRHGILVHRYGPHIFHTAHERVWSYLSRFTAWRPYEHHVLARIRGVAVPLPFNLTSLRALFPPRDASAIERKLLAAFADFVYHEVFAGYSRKQWGLAIEELDANVSSRVPVVVGEDDRYFIDTHQAMPQQGYGALFRRMLDNPLIVVRLSTEWRSVRDSLREARIIFTGMIDEYFDQRYGALGYRSLQFRQENHPVTSYQEVATVNYPGKEEYTRITEFTKLTDQRVSSTTIAVEYPRPRERATDEAYYPIPSEDNRLLHARYAEDARKLPGVNFVGRLGQYRYLNMDDTVKEALEVVDRLAASGSDW